MSLVQVMEVEHHGNQASCLEEASDIARMIHKACNGQATWTDRDGVVRPLEPKNILVIAPYNAQVGQLHLELAKLNVDIGTVDKFQGQEAPLVFYSCTSSTPEDAPRGMSFLYDPHRLNVASSRAMCAFVLVASPALFTPEAKTLEQMRQANGMCRLRELAQRI